MKVLVLVFVGIIYCSALPSFQFNDVLDVESFEHPTEIDMIIQEGYPVENHYVTTPDGYILNLHRIPSGKTGKNNQKVVFLQHGLLASSTDWVIAGPGKSLGYILADEGYDVWMGNARGNVYSRNHTTLNPDTDSEFWHFSWHEIGKIDLPTMIDYVLKVTNVEKIYYIGHSQGTTAFYVMASTRPEYNEKIWAQVSLAPIAFMNHMTSPLMRFLAFWDTPLSVLAPLIGFNEFLPSNGFLSMISEATCSSSLGQILCKNALFAMCGFSNAEMNTTLLPKLLAYTPAGASTRQVLHYAQEVNSGKFRQYDFGLVQNKIKYGSFSPPDYDLASISVPVYLIYSQNDWLAGEVDVKRLCKGLSNCSQLSMVTDLSFNHIDFIYGIDAPTLVYDQVIDILDDN